MTALGGRPREVSGDSGHLGIDAVILAEWLLKFRKKVVRLALRTKLLNNWTADR